MDKEKEGLLPIITIFFCPVCQQLCGCEFEEVIKYCYPSSDCRSCSLPPDYRFFLEEDICPHCSAEVKFFITEEGLHIPL